MQYVLKNLKSFAKNYTGVFVLIVVCQLVCILLSFFSFGVYQNFLNETNKTIEGEEPEKFEGFQCFTVDGELPENADIHPSELTDFYNSVGEILGDKIDCITTDCGDFELLMDYKDGQIIFDQQFYDNIKRQYTWSYGRCFTQREFTGGEKVCVAPSICCDEYSNKEDLSYEDEETGEIVQTNIPYKAYQRDDKWYVKIYGTEYECIGFCDFSGLYYISQKDMPFSDVLDGNGYCGMLMNKDKTGNTILPDGVKDKKYFSDFGDNFDEVSALYSFLTPYEENSPCKTYAEWSYAYSGRLIYNYEPAMREGKWLADCKEEENVVHAVISPNKAGLKTGDIIEQRFATNSTEEGKNIVTIKVEIVGVFKDGAKFFGITPNSSAIQDDKFMETKNIEDVFYNYYQRIYGEPLIVYNMDELERYDVGAFMSNYALVPFKDDLSDEEYTQAYNDFMEFTSTDASFAEIKSSSLADVRKQLIILIPIIAGLLLLTVISILSLTAISTHKQLKNYGILYLCGGRWKQCAFINSISIFINTLLASCVTYIGFKLLARFNVLEKTVVKFGLQELLICIGVAVLIILVSLIMPFIIIGRTQPKEILKAEE